MLSEERCSNVRICRNQNQISYSIVCNDLVKYLVTASTEIQILILLLPKCGPGAPLMPNVSLEKERVKIVVVHRGCLTPASPEGARGEAALLARQAAEGSHHLHSVAGFDGIHQVVVQDDVHRARQLAGGGFLRHLLHSDGLVVLVAGEAKLRLQRVVLLILTTTDTGELREAQVENCPAQLDAFEN